MKMKIMIVFVLGLLGYGLAFYSDTVPKPPVAIDQSVHKALPAPFFVFEDQNGQRRDLQAFKGKVVIVNFWASWCPPCVAEFPHLLGVAHDFEDEAVLIAVSSDHDQGAMARFLKKLELRRGPLGPNVLIARDPENKITQDLFGAFRLPVTLVLDPALEIVHKYVGSEWDIESFKARVRYHLSG